MDDRTRTALLTAQRNEITEHHIHHRLARVVRDENNAALTFLIGIVIRIFLGVDV